MREYTVEKVSCSVTPISFDESLCIGCNRCAEVCQVGLLIPDEPGRHPIVMYPGECYYCGACVMECPKPGAIKLRHPLMNRARFIPANDLKEE